jgi:hypothetical protein
MMIDSSDEQWENAQSSIQERLEADSNTIVRREPQLPKQSRARRSTVLGIQIERSKLHSENAPSEIQESREPGANVTEQSE